jgi:hypothetical protein
MVTTLGTPKRHPKSGFYLFRKRVPEQLREALIPNRAGYGFFFDAHRAADDCRAGVEILARTLPRSGRTGLAALLQSAHTSRWRVWADGAPYALREMLKARGYRRSVGGRNGPRA